MTVYRYYTLYRPPAPGAIPRGALDVQVWDDRTFVPEINHTAWGTADYAQSLTQSQIDDYELLPANSAQPIKAT